MGKPTGFIDYARVPLPKRPVSERVNDWQEFLLDWDDKQSHEQAGRCMNCAVPMCHSFTGCPLGNNIPDWNDFVYRDQWDKALDSLHSTNNFPEFTGRICPAPCESACIVGRPRHYGDGHVEADAPVTIEYIEKSIADRGWKEGWIKPEPPRFRTGKKVAVIGSGPAGMAAAQQINRAGHSVTVYERSEYIGGLLRLGIPDFKLEKEVVQRRVDQMEAEGVTFKTSTWVGKDFDAGDLLEEYDAICLTGGSTQARDLPVPGRELKGVHFAMEYLTQQNRINEGQHVEPSERIVAEGKRVVILGGGDTGADCLGTAHRQGAEVVYQYELLPEPSEERGPNNPWPQWPLILRTSSAHEEGGVRDYNISTVSLSGLNGAVKKLNGVRVEPGAWPPKPIPGTEFELDTDLVLLAMGFVQPEHHGMLDQLGVAYDQRGNVLVDNEMRTSVPKVFSAGDMARGQSLVVWAIAEGREVARCVDEHLMGQTSLYPVLARPVHGTTAVHNWA
jgi:glutamate synthase (NADPH/NADH) small chain